MRISISRFIAVLCFSVVTFGAVSGIANAVTVQPALVRDVDEGALQPFQLSMVVGSITSGTQAAYIPVPAGKRMVIDYYSAQAQDWTGGAALMTIGTTVGGVFVSYIVYVNANTSNQVTQATKIYADPGTQVQIFVATNAGSCGGLISISGHYVNIP